VREVLAIEIERKFLLLSDTWRNEVSEAVVIRQGYFSSGGKASIRVRVEANQASLNIKSATPGISRQEYQYAIPVEEGQELLDTLCARPLIEKTRHFVRRGHHLWEIDEFHGENQGLIVAEIELQHSDETFEKPDWLGEEVSHALQYYNVSLVKRPFREWND
jgi:adenylate cyclase